MASAVSHYKPVIPDIQDESVHGKKRKAYSCTPCKIPSSRSEDQHTDTHKTQKTANAVSYENYYRQLANAS